MNKSHVIVLMLITNLLYGSGHKPLLSLAVEDSRHEQTEAPAVPTGKNKRVCNSRTIGLTSCLATGIVAVVLLSRLSSDSAYAPSNAPSNGTAPGNGTNPTPGPVFPSCTVGRPCDSIALPMHQKLNSSKIYAQEFEICYPLDANGGWGGCGGSYIPKILCYPNSTATVGEAEQEIVNALAPDCDNLPIYSTMGIATYVWTRPNSNVCADLQQVKKDNEEFLKEIKGVCPDIKRQMKLFTPQPSCNFTTIDPNKIFHGWICPQGGNNTRNKLKRVNHTKVHKGKPHKGKKR